MPETRYPANLFTSFPLPALLLLPDYPHTIADANLAYLKVTGTTAEMLIGKDFPDVFLDSVTVDGKDNLNNLQKSLQTVINTGKPHTMSIQQYTVAVSGEESFEPKFWIPENIPVQDDQYNLLYIIHTIRDIDERQSSLLLNNTEESFILLDRDFTIVSFNKQFHNLYKKYLGIDVKKGQSILDYAQPERKAITKEIYTRVLDGFSEESEIRVEFSAADIKHFAVKYQPARDEGNQIIGAFVTARDISKEKELQAGQQLLLTEFMQRNVFIETILENIPIGIAVNKITEGSATFVNRYFSEIYGWGEKDLTDINTFFQKVYPDEKYRKEITTRIMNDIQSGDPARMIWNDIRITTNTGEEKIVNAKNIPLPDQNLMISTVIDATQQAIRSAEIYRIKTNQDALINGTNDLIWSVDTRFCIITANRPYIQMMEIATKKNLSEGDSVFVEEFGEELNTKWRKYYTRALKGETFSLREQVYNPFIQGIEYALVSFNPMLTPDGNVFGVSCYSKNVTEDTLNLLALENTKEALNKIMNSSLDVICTIDENGLFTKLNAASMKIWGYAPEELIGKKFRELVYADDLSKTDKAASDIMSGIEMTNFENRYMRKDGSLVCMVWSASWDNTDKTMYCIARDATERINAESALVESEKKYKYLFENNPLPMFIWDFETLKIMDCNEETLLKYGYTRKEFLELTIKDIRPENEIPLIEEAIKTENAYGNIHKKIWEHKKKNGEPMFMDIAGHLIDFNGRRASLVMLNDVTEKIKTEAQIKQSEAHLAEAQRLARMGSWDYDFTADKLAWSEELYHVFSVDKQNFRETHHSFVDLVDTEDRAFVQQTSQRAQETGEPFKIEYRITTPKGEKRVIEEYGYGEKDPNGKVIRLFGTAQNITERKKSEQLIKESEAKFRSLVESSMDGILLTAKDGSILAANTAACEMFRMTEQEICQAGREGLVDLTDPRLKPLLQERDSKGKAKGELNFIRKDGTVFPGEITSVLFTDANYQERTSMIIRDVTEMKKAAVEIKESNQRYEYVTKATFDAIWDWDLVTGTLYWGEGFQTIFGYDLQKNKIDITSWTDHIHPEDIDRVVKGIYKFLAGSDINWEDGYRYLKNDQSYAHVLDKGFAIRDDQGKAIRMVGAMRDITRQKKEEYQLKLLESVITNTTDAVLITEAESLEEPGPRIVYVNEAFTKMTGYTSEEIIGKTPRILQGPKSDKKELEKLSRSLRKWEPCELTIVNYKKNGEEFWIDMSISPIADEKGWFTHWIAIERDITERKLAEIRLTELNARLENHTKELARSNAELEQFAYVASHDLQEPLRMITNFLSQLEKKYGNVIDDKGKKYIDFAVDGAKRMRRIILDLLEFSRIGRTEDLPEELDLNELISEVQILYRKQIEDKKAVITVDGLPVIIAHQAPLRQIFQNLISNALKYSKEETPSQIHISATETDMHWQFLVADNGIGIDKEYFDKIFILFQRLHNKDEYSGTGIGLSITKKIVENLGGKIWVESEADRGSRFYFTLLKSNHRL